MGSVDSSGGQKAKVLGGYFYHGPDRLEHTDGTETDIRISSEVLISKDFFPPKK